MTENRKAALLLSQTPGRLTVVDIVHATTRRRWFVIATGMSWDSTNHYVVETIKSNGRFGSRQVRDLWDRVFDTPEQAIAAVRLWDQEGI